MSLEGNALSLPVPTSVIPAGTRPAHATADVDPQLVLLKNQRPLGISLLIKYY